MFSHIFLIRMRILMRDRQQIFWTLLFPIVLVTFLHMAMSNIANATQFRSIPLAVVNDAAYQADSSLRQALDQLSTGDDALLAPRVVDQAEALALLADKQVSGVLQSGENLVLTINENGLPQTVLKSVVDQYAQMRSMFERLARENPAALPKAAAALASGLGGWTESAPISPAAGDPLLIYYFAVIAMTCLYSGFYGLREIHDIQADQSMEAARLNISPQPKVRIFLISLLAALLIQTISILLVIAYMRLILGISLGDRLGLIVLASFFGCLTGISIGAAIGVIPRLRLGTKIGILIAVSMVGSLLAGMMVSQMKMIAIRAFPPIRWLNMGTVISETFYFLQSDDTLHRFWRGIGIETAVSALLFAVIFLMTRRQRYASL